MTYILRRRKLGRTSVREIVRLSTTGITAVLNDRDPIPEDPDALCIRWGCTSTVPQRNVLNTAESIHRVSDKSGFRMLLSEQPDGELCPPTWFTLAGYREENSPCIIRPRFHHQGRNVYYASHYDTFVSATRMCGDGWYASKYIPKVAEYRVFVVSGRACAVAKKTPANPEAIAWNVAQGGRFDNVPWSEWPLKAVKYSINAFNLSGLDFGGVDVMVDADGECYVLEINSAPSLTSPYRQECMAKCFDYIVTHGKAKMDLIPIKGGYRKFIHPAVCNEATVGL